MGQRSQASTLQPSCIHAQVPVPLQSAQALLGFVMTPWVRRYRMRFLMPRPAGSC